MNNIIKKIRDLLKINILVAGLYVIIMGLIWGYDFVYQKDKTYCGRIWKKVPEIRHGKYSATDEYILIIDFEKIGRQELNVSRSMFFSKEENDDVCFTLNPRYYEHKPYQFGKELWGVFVLMVVGLGLLWLVIKGIIWIFND